MINNKTGNLKSQQLNKKINELYELYHHGKENVLGQLVELLVEKSKFIAFKYFSILKKYGFTIDLIEEHQKHYAIEFTMESYKQLENVGAYFVGYLNHKFHSILDKEQAQKRLVNKYSISMDEKFDGSDDTMHDVLSCNENIANWYNGRDILDRYIYDESSTLLNSVEKRIILMKVEGYSYREISNEYKITYKEAVSLYTRGINKLKKELRVY